MDEQRQGGLIPSQIRCFARFWAGVLKVLVVIVGYPVGILALTIGIFLVDMKRPHPVVGELPPNFPVVVSRPDEGVWITSAEKLDESRYRGGNPLSLDSPEILNANERGQGFQYADGEMTVVREGAGGFFTMSRYAIRDGEVVPRFFFQSSFTTVFKAFFISFALVSSAYIAAAVWYERKYGPALP